MLSRSTPACSRGIISSARTTTMAAAPRPGPSSRRRRPAAAARAAGSGADHPRLSKSDLTEQVVAAVEGMTKKDASAAVDAVFEGISAALAAGGEVAVAGFGSFKVGERAAREGRNPRTGEAIPIAAASVAKFVPGKALRERVNGGGGGERKGAAGPAAAGGRKTSARAPTAASAGRKTAARRSTKSK